MTVSTPVGTDCAALCARTARACDSECEVYASLVKQSPPARVKTRCSLILRGANRQPAHVTGRLPGRA
jgi:hypothetical protein